MGQEIRWMVLSSGVHWRKSPCSFSLEYLDCTTNITFPLRTIPVRHLGSVDDGKKKRFALVIPFPLTIVAKACSVLMSYGRLPRSLPPAGV